MGQIINFKNNQRKIILKHDQDYLSLVTKIERKNWTILKKESDIKSIPLNSVKPIVIQSENNNFITETYHRLRRNTTPEISLSPIYILTRTSLVKAQTIPFVDGFISNENFESVDINATAISKTLGDIRFENWETDQELITLKVFGYLKTRKEKLQPIFSREFKTGYYYPLISLFRAESKTENPFNIINFWIENSLISGELVSTIHLCKSCKGNYLNFQETCPKCSSISFETSTIIHHFRCAHIAPESDFLKNGELECPKCQKTLRHIGIDYDKPSEMSTCKSCNTNFQESTMQVECMDCSTINQLEELIRQDVNNLELTQKGETLLFFQPEFKEVNNNELEVENSISLKSFELLLAKEIQKVKNNKSKSSFIKINLKYDSAIRDNNSTEKISELLRVIFPYLDPLDLVSTDQESNIYILTDRYKKNELKHYEIMLHNVSTLVHNNMHHTEAVGYIHKINEKDNYIKLLTFDS